MRLGQELKRLGRHSAIYGLGGLVSRILATLLLPLYTHYLPPGSYGRVELVTAATAVLAIVLQMGISSAFFRFYFDAKEDAERLTVIRTSFWFTMTMSTVGMPLVPSALALWTINVVDREFVSWYKGNAEVGVYSAAVKIAGVITFVMVAFRTAWPAFAYSIEDDREAKRTYSFVLTYLLTLTSWVSLALGALAPWWVRLLTDPRYHRAEKGVALLAFAGAVYAGYVVLAIGSGRARKTQLNW